MHSDNLFMSAHAVQMTVDHYYHQVVTSQEYRSYFPMSVKIYNKVKQKIGYLNKQIE